jgi:hypothetical protein
LLFPAFVLAVKAGLRLLRAGRAAGRESLRGALVFLETLPPRAVLALREGLLLRALAPGLPAVFAPLLWCPLRWPHAGAGDFAVRAPEAPLVGRTAFPLDLIPLDLIPLDFTPWLEPFPT